MARATAARWIWPPESWEGRWSRCSLRPIRLASSLVLWLRSSGDKLKNMAGSSMFWRRVRVGSR